MVFGCTSFPAPLTQSPTIIAPFASGELPLVTQAPFNAPPGMPVACGGVGLDAVLRGDRADPRLVWLENHIQGTTVPRIEALWPAGYRVRFSPKAEVLDASDQVVLRDGDRVTGACAFGPEGAYLVAPFK